MNTTLAILGALGGIGAFGAGVWTIVRSIARQIGATKDNTEALHDLRDTVMKLDTTVDDHTTRIARLEGWVHRQ